MLARRQDGDAAVGVFHQRCVPLPSIVVGSLAVGPAAAGNQLLMERRIRHGSDASHTRQQIDTPARERGVSRNRITEPGFSSVDGVAYDGVNSVPNAPAASG